MLRRTFVAAAAVAVTAVAALVVAASPASATTSQCSRSNHKCAGKTEFIARGEHLKVTDRVGDGHSAVALYWLEGGRGPFRVWNHNGHGKTVDHNLDLAEESWIFYQVCLGNYGKRDVFQHTCSPGVTAWA